LSLKFFQGKIPFFQLIDKSIKGFRIWIFLRLDPEQSQSLSLIIIEEFEHQCLFEVIGMNFAN